RRIPPRRDHPRPPKYDQASALPASHRRRDAARISCLQRGAFVSAKTRADAAFWLLSDGFARKSSEPRKAHARSYGNETATYPAWHAGDVISDCDGVGRRRSSACDGCCLSGAYADDAATNAQLVANRTNQAEGDSSL